MSETVRLDEVRAVPDMTISGDPGPEANGGVPAPAIQVEDWSTFLARSDENVPCVVDRLWPEGALGFLSSPPKKGKTWLALSLALSITTGQPFLGHFRIPNRKPVLYVALEGHRAAIADRISVLARGLGLDPTDQIPGMHITYKPRGLNISDPVWANALIEQARLVGAAMVIVDVLRAAAILKENAPEDFARLRANLEPLAPTCAAALLHHFTKLSEISKERDPGERMSGSGAMFGALDVGIYITGSQDGARRLRLEFDCRDIATPGTLGVYLEGQTTGDNGGFGRTDKAWWIRSAAPDEDDVDVPAEEIVAWLTENPGEHLKSHIAAAMEVSTKTVERREPRLEQLGVEITRERGKPNLYSWPGPQDEQATLAELPGYAATTDPRHTHDRHPRHDPVSKVTPHEQSDSDPRQTPTTPTPVAGRTDNEKTPYAAETHCEPTHDTHDFPYGEEASADAAHVPVNEPHDLESDDINFDA